MSSLTQGRLDRALATPTVGFLLKPEVYTEHDYLTALKPLLERWAAGGDLNISYPGVAQISIQTATGFNYTATTERLVVQFGYQYDLKDQPGARPILHYRVEPEKYSVLLQRAIDESCDFVGRLVGSGSRKLTRIGIVATVRVNSQSPPPGIKVFLRFGSGCYHKD